MSELFQAPSGEWNDSGNQSTFEDVAKEPTKDQVKRGDNSNMFGAVATTPSAVSGGHGQDVRPRETAPTVEHNDKPETPKKANPFV